MAFKYDVQVCLGSLPKIQNRNLKVQIMRAFAEGAERAGARTIVNQTTTAITMYSGYNANSGSNGAAYDTEVGFVHFIGDLA